VQSREVPCEESGGQTETIRTEGQVIDLCGDEDESTTKTEEPGAEGHEPKKGAIEDGAVKNEPSANEGASVKKEATVDPTQECDGAKSTKSEEGTTATVTPQPANKLRSLKPHYEEGDEVYAAWPENDEWYSGRVKSYKTIDRNGKYGLTCLYDIIFDDGDEMDDLQEHFMQDKRDYLLTDRDWVGVENVTDEDKGCADR